MTAVLERLTREQMAEKYPDQWIEITNIKYMDNDGVTVEAADILYNDKSNEELMLLQIELSSVRLIEPALFRLFEADFATK